MGAAEKKKNSVDPQADAGVNFYENLPGFSRFELLVEDQNFHPAPADWFVVITDVQGSTKAINDGRYRDVNILGAASVAVVESLFKGEKLPFIFGGDGASFLIPPHKIDQVRKVLSSFKTFSRTQFKLELRVGVVPVSEIYSAGRRLEIAKFEITSSKVATFFRGGGLAWAEHQIKTLQDHYCLKAEKSEQTDRLSGLSCRWQPLPSRKGVILTILVQAGLLDSMKTFKELLLIFNRILGGNLDGASPVQTEVMEYKNFWACLADEWRYNERKFSKAFLRRMMNIFICIWAFRFGLPSPFPAKKYFSQISSHSDYRKYDDMLRLILDCTKEQAREIEAHLQSQFLKGEIFYGVHESSHALMTCLVDNVDEGGHIHFIDGSDGGYTLAAKKLKTQLRRGSHAA